jgi:two-component system chemotaxis response regulator CheB
MRVAMGRDERQLQGRDVIVVGASAGGVQVLQELMRGLPADLPAAVFIVIHTSPSSPGILPNILDRAGPLAVAHAVDGEPVRHRRVYVAPPDHHLLVRDGVVRVTHGPKENGFRPAVDPLFRTAARSAGPRVVGVVLSGGLDDGTIGLTHVKYHGGVAVVQDPNEAVFPSMPASAVQNVEVDHIVPVAAMPALLMRLATEPIPEGAFAMAHSNADDDRSDVAEAGKAALLTGTQPGPPSALTCPECGGALWELKDGKLVRYQCHVGHSYTAESLVAEKNGELEAVLWSALRALEENAELRRRMAERARQGPGAFGQVARRYEAEAAEVEQRAAVLREMLANGEKLRSARDKGSAQRKARNVREQSVGGKVRAGQGGRVKSGRAKPGIASRSRNGKSAGNGR